MLMLKVYFVALTLGGLQCLAQAGEQAAVQFSVEQDSSDPMEARTTSPDDITTVSKSSKQKTPNVHIENFYIPQQIQKGHDSVDGYPIYPALTYGNVDDIATNKRPANFKRPQNGKKPKPLNLQHHTTQFPAQKPSLQKVSFEIPHKNKQPIRFKQNSQTLSPLQEAYPHLVVFNSPQSGHKRRPKPVQTITASDILANHQALQQHVAQTPKRMHSNLPKSKGTRSDYQKDSIRLSDLDGNLGLSLVKFILEQPQQTAADKSKSSSYYKKEYDNEEEDDIEDDDDESEEELQENNSHIESNNDESVADYGNFEDMFSTKSNKLPLDFVWDLNTAKPKVDDRIAVVFLRHYKRGRQYLWADN